MAEPKIAESTVQFDAEEYEEHQENPNQETPIEFPKSDIKQYLTFDDVQPSKWRERSIEMLTWCTIELQYYTIDVVIKRFLTKIQGRLRDWYHSLGEYRQLQIQQSISPEAFMSIIYSEFIGSPWEHTSYAREEFLKMKCCSFQKKDLEKHYDRMSQRFYYLNGVDDANLKQNPPQWTSRQTKAAEKMPPLKILSSAEKRILQTDASDECWGAVLLVQHNNNKRHVCGYKSGFIPSMGGGTIGLDESLLYTADIEFGWGDACDKKAMHGCPRIKKASIMKTFT
ncbi:hypothetical protein Tco_0378824 [Tanacetum coccineum]